jgi:hypothetical protein
MFADMPCCQAGAGAGAGAAGACAHEAVASAAALNTSVTFEKAWECFKFVSCCNLQVILKGNFVSGIRVFADSTEKLTLWCFFAVGSAQFSRRHSETLSFELCGFGKQWRRSVVNMTVFFCQASTMV